MADIELIVKIDADVYTRLFDNGIQDNEIATDDICEMARSLRLGTPLPKGHGDLKDSKFLDTRLNFILNHTGGYKNTPIGTGIVIAISENLDAPTIIEADNEGEDYASCATEIFENQDRNDILKKRFGIPTVKQESELEYVDGKGIAREKIEKAIKMLHGMKADNLNLDDLYTKDKYEALSMAIKALETLEEFEKAQIITGGRLNGRTYAYKCGLEDGKRKALEQETYKVSEYDKDHIWYKGVQYISLRRFLEVKSEEKNEPCDNAVNRQVVKEQMIKYGFHAPDMTVTEFVEDLPPVTPQPKIGRWIEERTYMECPNCHDIWHYEENQTERFKCCPTCGKGLNNESKYIRNRVRNNRTN